MQVPWGTRHCILNLAQEYFHVKLTDTGIMLHPTEEGPEKSRLLAEVTQLAVSKNWM